MNDNQKEIEAEEEYLISSESVPMHMSTEAWKYMCSNSNFIIDNDDVIERLQILVEKQAFNYLINNDCMLNPKYVQDIYNQLCSKDVLYVERSKYMKEEVAWFRWTIKMSDGEVIYSLRNETLGTLIKRLDQTSLNS